MKLLSVVDHGFKTQLGKIKDTILVSAASRLAHSI